MGKRIFIDDQEMTNKDDFDGKINIANPLYTAAQNPYFVKDSLFAGQNQNSALGVIHNQFGKPNNNVSDTIGSWDSLLFFGGDDVRHAIDIGTFDHQIRIFTKASNNPAWYEDLVLKSDYDKLSDRVSALENKIGGH